MRVALGLGCDRGTPVETLSRAVGEALELAGQRGWSLHFYDAAELAEVQVPNPSETVRRYTGTPSVSEAAALLAAGAAPASSLLVEKHILRGDDGRHATVSVARCR